MHKYGSWGCSPTARTVGQLVAGSCLAVLVGCSSSSGNGTGAQLEGGAGNDGSAASNDGGAANDSGATGNDGSVQGAMNGTGVLAFSIPSPYGSGQPQQFGDDLWDFELVAIGDGTGISETWSATFKKGVALAVGTFHQSDLDNDGLVLNLGDGGAAVNDTATNTNVDKLSTDPVTLIITSASVDSNGATVCHGSLDATLSYSKNATGTEHLTATF